MTSTDQPALDDDVTARLFELSVQRVRNGTYGQLMLPATTVMVVWMWTTAAPVLAVLLLAVGLVGTWMCLRELVPGASRWPAIARRLLSEQPWRETPGTVLDTRGTVLALADGTCLRVYGLPKPAREVAVRTGRVRVVGPDRTGWFVARVDGLHTPWPARLVPARKAVPATPTTEPVVAAWGRYRVARARGDIWFAVAGTAVVAVMAWLIGDPWLGALVAAAAVVSGALLVRQLRRTVRLRDAGPWRRAEASVPSWTSRQNGLGDGIIALRFPDGQRFTAHLERVPLDLFANAWREEALWVAGDVVGFPDYPVAAFARLTREH